MHIVIIGGAGFIGINASSYFLKKKHKVTIFDNCSRPGSKENLIWLNKENHRKLKVITGDIRTDIKKLTSVIHDADVVLHLAGQVAVTSSVTDPLYDCAVNINGTLSVLEAARMSKKKPIVLYSSTNKVYGELDSVRIREENGRYSFSSLPYGISESQPLDFHSPYGCSKGAADQYVRDYYRIYGLPTIVFRQSCIYGPHQHGVEDQGWVAWFMLALQAGKKLTIYGNGKQVRDLLYIDDLVRGYELAIQHISKTKGQIYNIGGGSKNTLSVWHEFKPILEDLFQRNIHAKFSKTRPGDQPIYISDIRKAKRDFGWRPQISLAVGIRRLYAWIQSHDA